MRERNIGIPAMQQEQVCLGNDKKSSKSKEKKQIKKLLIGIMIILVIIVVLLITIFMQKNPERHASESQQITDSASSRINNVLFDKGDEAQKDQLVQEEQTQIVKSNKLPQNIIQKNSGIAELPQNKHLNESFSQNLVNNRDIYSFLKKRMAVFSNHLSPYLKMSPTILRETLAQSQITKQQFKNAIELMTYSPLILNNSQKMSKALQTEKNHYESQYNISSYKQIQFCVIVPTYKNVNKFRYFMNLYTIMQQEYDHYHVVIIDDASEDKTANKIQKQIRENPYVQKKVTLVRNAKREFHMANIYNAVYKYCKAGEILSIIDGDDQLVGKQVFKLFNAAYHRSEAFAIYSNHIESKKDVSLQIGISKAYPPEVVSNNSYRQAKHFYSHLKTAWTDLFFQIKQESFKSNDGKWYNNAVDNAIFLSIFELACGRVQYLPQITYKYNTFTGNSVANMDYNFRKATADEIRNKPKYRCINDTNPEIYKKILSYIQK